MVLTHQPVWSPWGIGVLSPFADDDDAIDANSPKERRRSHSWGGFARFAQRSEQVQEDAKPTENVMLRSNSKTSLTSTDTSETGKVGQSFASASTDISETDMIALGQSFSNMDTDETNSQIAKKAALPDLETATTLMIRNLPFNVKRKDLLHVIDASGFAGLYDFVYLPHKFREHRNLGFAFINFETPEVAKHFHELWHLSRRFTVKGTCKGIKALNVSVAAVQGRDANVLQASSHKIDRVKNTSYRPFTSAGFTGLTN
jgi:hypothetical protein